MSWFDYCIGVIGMVMGAVYRILRQVRREESSSYGVWLSGGGVGKAFPEMWSAKDGATKPYRDVFTGVFWESLPDTAAA